MTGGGLLNKVVSFILALVLVLVSVLPVAALSGPGAADWDNPTYRAFCAVVAASLSDDAVMAHDVAVMPEVINYWSNIEYAEELTFIENVLAPWASEGDLWLQLDDPYLATFVSDVGDAIWPSVVGAGGVTVEDVGGREDVLVVDASTRPVYLYADFTSTGVPSTSNIIYYYRVIGSPPHSSAYTCEARMVRSSELGVDPTALSSWFSGNSAGSTTDNWVWSVRSGSSISNNYQLVGMWIRVSSTNTYGAWISPEVYVKVGSVYYYADLVPWGTQTVEPEYTLSTSYYDGDNRAILPGPDGSLWSLSRSVIQADLGGGLGVDSDIVCVPGDDCGEYANVSEAYAGGDIRDQDLDPDNLWEWIDAIIDAINALGQRVASMPERIMNSLEDRFYDWFVPLMSFRTRLQRVIDVAQTRFPISMMAELQEVLPTLFDYDPESTADWVITLPTGGLGDGTFDIDLTPYLNEVSGVTRPISDIVIALVAIWYGVSITRRFLFGGGGGGGDD